MSSAKTVNMIKRIVRLRQLLNRWKSKSLTRGSNLFSDEPADPSRRTPSGSVAVYVGPERRRFIVPTRFLNLPVFVALLNQAEEEFGYQPTGGLALPCETGFFSDILRLLEQDEEKFRGLGLHDFVQAVSQLRFQSSCKESPPPPDFHAVTPLLLQKIN